MGGCGSSRRTPAFPAAGTETGTDKKEFNKLVPEDAELAGLPRDEKRQLQGWLPQHPSYSKYAPSRLKTCSGEGSHTLGQPVVDGRSSVPDWLVYRALSHPGPASVVGCADGSVLAADCPQVLPQAAGGKHLSRGLNTAVCDVTSGF